ncbi:hypothetical protein U9M48_031461 [Paspalum notatum var. saurae]|uniref:PTBP1-like RNA recognition motif 2 domain-containing protein n=1 Tax=Paspalum notatum var. saurae TaxID=547442 RepID=A0AAQ3U5V8_PASNO
MEEKLAGLNRAPQQAACVNPSSASVASSTAPVFSSLIPVPGATTAALVTATEAPAASPTPDAATIASVICDESPSSTMATVFDSSMSASSLATAAMATSNTMRSTTTTISATTGATPLSSSLHKNVPWMDSVEVSSTASATTISPFVGAHKVFYGMPFHQEMTQASILHVMVSHMLYPITEEVMHQLFDPYGAENVQLLLVKSQVEALISFRSYHDAMRACNALNGRCIWDGCCVMSISQVQCTTIPATPTSLASMATEDTNILLLEDMSDEVPAPVEEMALRQKAFGALDAVRHDHVTMTPNCVLLRNAAVEDDCMLRVFLGVQGHRIGKASAKHLKYQKPKSELICEALGGCLSLQTSTTPQATSMMVSATAPRIDINCGIGVAVSANTSKAAESMQRRYIHLNLTDAIQLCYATDNHEAYKLFEGLNNQTQMLSCQPCFLDDNTLLQMGVTACCIFDHGKIKQGDVTVAVTKHWPPPMQMEMLEQTDLIHTVFQSKPPWSSMNNEQSFKLRHEGLHLNTQASWDPGGPI